MNLSQLAQLAHVSVSTVSKAFSASSDIAPETRQYIFDIAKEHGCFEKYYKEKYDRPIIAVICPEIRSTYYTAFLDVLEQRIRDWGAALLLFTTNFDRQQEMDILHYCRCFAKVSGIICIGGYAPTHATDEIPVVKIGATNHKTDHADHIQISNKGIYDAILHLKENGHKKIAFIGEKLTISKQEHFVKAMNRQKLPVMEEYLITSDYRFEQAGEDCMQKLLSLSKRPTAIVAAYDYIAFGAINHIRRNGFCVPEDFSIIGMDNISPSDYQGIRLTSVKVDFLQVCNRAFDLLQERLKHPHPQTHVQEVFETVLIKRDSVTTLHT
ncbi:MAG: LacI family transcriptional regulator [Ruminococcaceae bacterium]|nr:LacI family transcriptional regulator [Oscillospiraceae bacterium]